MTYQYIKNNAHSAKLKDYLTTPDDTL